MSGLAPLVAGTETIWIASALSDDDRAANAGLADADGFRVELVNHDPAVLRMAYDVVGNSVLWFVHHGLFELARRPRYDQLFRDAWEAYRRYNRNFADTIVATAPAEAIVLVQDYHLSLLAPLVVASRPDLSLVHFAHTPFGGPELLSVLPDPYRQELLEGLSANQACGFHTDRWRRRFVASCEAFSVLPPRTFVSSLAPDGADLARVAATEECKEWQRSFEERFDGQQLIVRVDRIELSKNILRGFWAYEELLDRWPAYRGSVCLHGFHLSLAGGAGRVPGLPPGGGVAGGTDQQTVRHRRLGPRGVGRPPMTSPVRWRCSAATTCCWSIPSATG